MTTTKNNSVFFSESIGPILKNCPEWFSADFSCCPPAKNYFNNNVEEGISLLLEKYYLKKVYSVKKNINSLSYEVFFVDGERKIFSDIDIYTIENMLSKTSSCPSCGEKHDMYVAMDSLNRCQNTLKKIGESIKKLYWYRKSKDPNFKLIE